MYSRVEGSVMLFNEVSPANANSSMLFRELFSPKDISEMAEQPLKVFSSIVCTALGIETDCRRRLSAKASLAMLVTVVGNLIVL